MDISKKYAPKSDRKLGVLNLHKGTTDTTNPPYLACLSPRVIKDIPVPYGKRKDSIKSLLRRSLPSGSPNSRARLPSPHWRHRYSLPTPLSISRTDPELQVQLLRRSCSSVALSLKSCESDADQVTRQSRSKRRSTPKASGGSQVDLLRRRCLKGETLCDNSISRHMFLSTCPDLPLPRQTSLSEQQYQDVEEPEEERHPLEQIWKDELSYHRFDNDLDIGNLSYFIFSENLYAEIDL